MKKDLVTNYGGLQRFAKFEDIIAQHSQALEGSNVKDSYSSLSTKLNELGYDVLINNKKEAEFVPSSRLSEVVSQRDNFKNKVEEMNAQFEDLKKQAGSNETLKTEYQKLIDNNNGLLQELEQTRINSEIMITAKDAINAKDILVFVNKNNIKVNSKGEILGVDSEIERLKKEKPYLFQPAAEDKSKKGGSDKDDKGASSMGGMNAMIRKAVGRTF